MSVSDVVISHGISYRFVGGGSVPWVEIHGARFLHHYAVGTGYRGRAALLERIAAAKSSRAKPRPVAHFFQKKRFFAEKILAIPAF